MKHSFSFVEFQVSRPHENVRGATCLHFSSAGVRRGHALYKEL